MTIAEFESMVEKLKASKPQWFELDSDPPATTDQVQAAERSLGVEFPEEYVRFLKRHGGGYFAFGNVFSVDEASDWNVVVRNREGGLLGRGFLAVSDNGVGDYYGFPVQGKLCMPSITFWDHETSQVSPLYDGFFDFLAAVALKP